MGITKIMEDTGITSLNILGLGEPTLTMIFDNLASNNLYPSIRVINNLNRTDLIPFRNPLFDITLKPLLEEADREAPCFLGVTKPDLKRKLTALYQCFQLEFINIINKFSFISSTTILGRGAHINSMVSIAAFSTIGDFVSINRNASIGHHTELGDYVTINPGVNIAGFVKINEGVQIGMGVNVFDRIEIGARSVIGAGSVVTRNIPDHVVAYGNPCKIIRSIES
ncbi:MAG: acetyltransferase [Bacteroidota bacterium]|nr:acetyltransferase [Bacteroidota bacterium]